MLDPHDIVITGDLNFNLDIVSEPHARQLSETLADRGMTRLVTDATHNKGHLLAVAIVRNHSALVSTRPSVDTNAYVTHVVIHPVITFCVNARKPA